MKTGIQQHSSSRRCGRSGRNYLTETDDDDDSGLEKTAPQRGWGNARIYRTIATNFFTPFMMGPEEDGRRGSTYL